jgi:hypothetical protein
MNKETWENRVKNQNESEIPPPEERLCKRHGKPILESRWKNRSRNSGCRDCLSGINKQYRQKNKLKTSQRDKKYYRENKLKIRQRQKKYNQKNKLKISQNNKKYYEANKERIKLYDQTPIRKNKNYFNRIKRRNLQRFFEENEIPERERRQLNEFYSTKYGIDPGPVKINTK